MNVALFLLLDDKWIQYCKSVMPNAPCDPPPGMNTDFTLSMVLCGMFGIAIAITAVYHAITRLRTTTRDEFLKANERVRESIPLLALLQGKPLRRECRVLSRDLILITGYAGKRISACLHQYYFSTPWQSARMRSLMLFMGESKALHTDAVFVTFLYFIPLLTRPMAKYARTTAERYSTQWLTLLEQYKIENPECQSDF